MSYLDPNLVDLGAESQDEAQVSIAVLERKRDQLAQQLDAADPADTALRARLLLESARIETDLEQPTAAWQQAMDALQFFLGQKDWERAVLACDALFASGAEDALVALGHGLWLSITFPVDPSLTVRQLMHVIEETPEDSDGAAVAAAVAAYVVELRAEGNQQSELTLAVSQLLNDVARRHGGVDNQQQFDAWFARLELNDPAKFLVRMRNVIDVLVQDHWWIDRAALQAGIPGGD